MKIGLQPNSITTNSFPVSTAKENTNKSQSVEEDSFAAVFAEIREKGLLKYAEEKRTEELRKEILAKMGLTEGALTAMTVERRMALEKVIEEEIQKRLAAARELENDEQPV